MRIHEVKSHKENIEAIKDGRPFDVRKNDRSFGVGDWLHLREYMKLQAGKYGDLHVFATICASRTTEHWKEPRFLTIAEGKRLQGLPDDFVLEGSYGARWARIGNSVPPPMMKAIALHVRKTVLGRGKDAKGKKGAR